MPHACDFEEEAQDGSVFMDTMLLLRCLLPEPVIVMVVVVRLRFHRGGRVVGKAGI